jgi:GR25 family glycosyltransferase involved in LPS biosynthesis
VIVPATTPETLKRDLGLFHLEKKDWKYPRKGEKRIDLATGLHLTGYGANDVEKVISCMVSHMRCWMFCLTTQYPAIILEHDALFVNKFNAFHDITKDLPNKYDILNSYGIVGLNNPKGATRKASIYYDEVLKESENSEVRLSGHKVIDAPWVDDNKDAPQGLAGNSAYYISNKMAQKLLVKIKEIGLWPNDALMCKQLFSNQIKQMYPFMTELQGVKSTTQG